MNPLWVVLAAGVGALAGPAQEGGEGPAGARIVSARLSATVHGEGWGEVRVVYEFTGGRPGAPVGLHVLDFGTARVREVEVDGVSVPLEPTPGRPARRHGELSVDPSVRRLTLDYRVDGAWTASGEAGRVRVPVVVLDLPLEEAGEALFRARLRVPEEWSVSGAFPTGSTREADGTWASELAVVPALVGLRARTDGSWRPGLPLVLDVLALAVLGGFGVVGLRHLRGVVDRAEAAP